jgi:hypothetical protein
MTCCLNVRSTLRLDPVADHVHNCDRHQGKQCDSGERVEYRDGEKYIFHDLNFLELNFDLPCRNLDFTAETMFRHLDVLLLTFMRRFEDSATYCTTVIATGSRA